MGATLDPQMGKKYRNRPKVPEGDPDEEPASRNQGGGGRGSLGGLFRGKRAVDTTPIDPKCFPKSTSVPSSLDYRGMGKVTPVKFQGTCGSCWAFAAAAVFESQYAIQTNGTLLDFSEQYLIEC